MGISPVQNQRSAGNTNNHQHKISTVIEVLDLHTRIAFLDGKIEGIRDYAIWHNGEQLVGCLEKPLKEVIAPYRQEQMELLAKLKQLK